MAFAFPRPLTLRKISANAFLVLYPRFLYNTWTLSSNRMNHANILYSTGIAAIFGVLHGEYKNYYPTKE